MSEPQTEALVFPIGDAPWQRMVERIDAMPEGRDRSQAQVDLNAMLIERRECLRAALATDPARPDEQASALLSALANINVHSAEDLTRFVEFVQAEARMFPLVADTARPGLDADAVAVAMWNTSAVASGPFATTAEWAIAIAAEYARLTETRP